MSAPVLRGYDAADAAAVVIPTHNERAKRLEAAGYSVHQGFAHHLRNLGRSVAGDCA